ncbi:hypothetical protein RBK60_19100 [Pseudomonas aeruginosa]|uniref:hypothetical protein n=1 Tax=Pseudomonas aeruginosa TaxID=287 RepID=UPI000F8286A9|nr:hypothetical protein [Pseudomonas aeruginosa]MDZ5161805.1 hypothetical protein [Pseudomonas aeruginosa]MDZ5173009.1 hypothetical protein [Pseudomonas aeruginosa]MDZ5183903.1 hypothetical protein [Pseudomonas aeruginosa]MDZ5189218.1 hypothetical protein [Pseudomonas aeruginosa]MDZ5196646.1 hypothetical protein [Pseudomonas aeruginosa]
MLHVPAFAQRGRDVDVDVDVEAQARLTLSVMSEAEVKCCSQGEARQRNPAARLADAHLSSPAVTGATQGSVFIFIFIAPVFRRITARQLHGVFPPGFTAHLSHTPTRLSAKVTASNAEYGNCCTYSTNIFLGTTPVDQVS